jgi:hypothetical protein
MHPERFIYAPPMLVLCLWYAWYVKELESCVANKVSEDWMDWNPLLVITPTRAENRLP